MLARSLLTPKTLFLFNETSFIFEINLSKRSNIAILTYTKREDDMSTEAKINVV